MSVLLGLGPALVAALSPRPARPAQVLVAVVGVVLAACGTSLGGRNWPADAEQTF